MNFSLKNFVSTILILLLMCMHTTSAQKRKKQEKTTPAGQNIEISDLELRVTMDSFFDTFVLTVTESADSIIAASQDININNQALLWKINAIPVAQGSILSREPFAAFVDMSVFCVQMKEYFENGKGKNLFGEYQSVAIESSKFLWQNLIDIGNELAGSRGFDKGITMIEEFAKNNPIQSSYFKRRSTLPLMARIQSVEKVKLKALAESMAASIDELTNRMNVYTNLLPRQARWHAQYAINNSVAEAELEQKFDSLYHLMERTVIFAESSPDIIDTQRIAMFKDLERERKIVLEAMRQERIAVLDLLQKEREIVLQYLNEEVTSQREASMEDLNNLSTQSINSSFDQLDSLADKFFWRTLILVLVLVAGILLGIILYKRI